MTWKTAGAIASLLTVGLPTGCGSDVRTPGSGGDGAGGGNTNVDPECYDACIDKGESVAVCEDACATKGTGAKGTGGKGFGGQGAGGGATTGVGGTNVDFELEKSCIQCWEENQDGPCGEALKACESSLACIQLRNCPFSCIDKSDCLDECIEIIPTGVGPLSELVYCMACNGGPCSAECEGSVFLSFCE